MVGSRSQNESPARTDGCGLHPRWRRFDKYCKGETETVIKLTISNQRGGVGKTTTAITLARCFADKGMKVLLFDSDSQGSIAAVLGLRPNAFLYDLLIQKLAFRECIVRAATNIDVICSNRYTVEAESAIGATTFREFTFEHLLSEHEGHYDAVIIDVSPSITLFQTCAMVYTQKILIPVDMDVLSVQGATSVIQVAETLNAMLHKKGLDVRAVGMLPIKVDRRLAMTDTVLNTLEDISQKRAVPLLSVIRTDQAVLKASKARQFLADYDPKSKALEDFNSVSEQLLILLEQQPYSTALTRETSATSQIMKAS
jgi:chromosome partitioning protein